MRGTLPKLQGVVADAVLTGGADIMATKNASGHQGQVKDPEHDGRLKGHKGGEAPKAHAEGKHSDEKQAAPETPARKKHEEEAAAREEHAKRAPAKAHKEPAHAEVKDEPKKAGPASKTEAVEPGGAEDADLKAREYTDAEGNVHHHTRTYMEQHKG